MEGKTARQSKGKQCAAGQSLPISSTSVSSVSWPRNLLWRFPFALLGGLVLRLWMMSAFPQTGGDSLIYGNIAQNILLRGQFALSDGSGVSHLTLIRLPGYPLFLAACFRLFGIVNYNAVAWLQIALELAACLLLADFVRRISSPRAGLNAFWLATLCPFTAVFSAAPLTESLTFDCICLALWSLNLHLASESGCPTLAAPLFLPPGGGAQILRRLGPIALFTLALSAAALLRPDGALLAFALWPALLFAQPASPSIAVKLRAALPKALLCAFVSILPFALWTGRNWQAFHTFEPLAPRYANDPGEDPHLGWQHWVKTWCLDFTCTYDIYWNVPDNQLDPSLLPARAFDSPDQKARTLALIASYNQNFEIPPELDARFEALAQERSHTHPLRTHVLLPLGRLADMLFRPRVENLTIDLHWWEYKMHRPETRFSWSYAALNGVVLLLGFAGFLYRPRLWPYMAAYLVLRSLLLMTIEAPETRYTLEFFPIIFALAGITLQRVFAFAARNIQAQQKT